MHKQDLALNNPQGLIYHKTTKLNQNINIFGIYRLIHHKFKSLKSVLRIETQTTSTL